MTHAFAGMLLLPGEEGDGLAAVLQAEPDDVKLTAGSEELGSWTTSECHVTPVGKGAFSVTLGGEKVLFTPDSPAQFAEVMAVPLQPEPVETKKQISVASKEEKARAKHLEAVQKAKKAAVNAKPEKELLGKGLTFLIVTVSTGLMASLLVLSFSL